jgi:hypothetical protein
MADDVTLPGTGKVVETREQLDGSHRQVIALGEAESAALLAVLKAIASPITFDPPTGSTRVSGSVVVSSLPTLPTLTNLAQVGGVPANTMSDDVTRAAWTASVRGRIT